MTGVRVSADYLGRHRLRPPRVELHFTLHLTGGDEAAWIVVPDTLAASPRSPATEVYSVSGWLLGEHRTIQLLHATSDSGWFAVHLPARATVSVADLPLAWWGESPSAVDIVAHQVTDLRVNGAPIAGPLGWSAAPLTDRVGEAAALADPAAVATSISGTPHRPVPVSWTEVGVAVAHVDVA